MRRVTLLHNRGAGSAKSSGKVLRQALTDAGFEVTYRTTKRGLKKSLALPADLVVVAGGDGTVAKVAKRLAGTDLPLAVIPLGIANNLARSLGLTDSAADLATAWRDARPQPFDLGTATGPGETLRFVEGFGGGLVAELIARNDEIAAADGVMGVERDRGLLVLQDIVREGQPGRWQVEVDGRDVSGDYLAVEVMNIPFSGPILALAPRADPHDGMLDVVLVRPAARARLLNYLAGRLVGGGSPPRLATRRGRHVVLTPPAGTALRVDDKLVKTPKRRRRGAGDVATYLVDALPGALQVMPNEGRPKAAASGGRSRSK